MASPLEDIILGEKKHGDEFSINDLYCEFRLAVPGEEKTAVLVGNRKNRGLNTIHKNKHNH